MTLERKNNHFSVISVPKLVKNEAFCQIIRLILQKFKIQDGRRRPFWIYVNKKICITSQSDTLVFLERQYICYQKIKSYSVHRGIGKSLDRVVFVKNLGGHAEKCTQDTTRSLSIILHESFHFQMQNNVNFGFGLFKNKPYHIENYIYRDKTVRHETQILLFTSTDWHKVF